MGIVRKASRSKKTKDPLLGKVIAGRYRLESQLGEGGMGIVYAARQEDPDRIVALDANTGKLTWEVETKDAVEASPLLHEGVLYAGSHDGNFYALDAQTGELLSPYSNILSIYEQNPSVIKAIMNEGIKYNVEVGEKVIVESSNRSYEIEGQVFEVGSRIIEYPNRLKSNQSIPLWGQELFIKIPTDNNFLNGERVFVKIKN